MRKGGVSWLSSATLHLVYRCFCSTQEQGCLCPAHAQLHMQSLAWCRGYNLLYLPFFLLFPSKSLPPPLCSPPFPTLARHRAPVAASLTPPWCKCITVRLSSCCLPMAAAWPGLGSRGQLHTQRQQHCMGLTLIAWLEGP